MNRFLNRRTTTHSYSFFLHRGRLIASISQFSSLLWAGQVNLPALANPSFKENIMAKKLLLVLILIGFSSSLVLGQVAISGQIRGIVTDVQGAALPNVTISAKAPR
jgi:hypothetical protein